MKPLVFQTPMMVISIILHSFAISSTIFRLAYRARFRQLWWDDFWAFFALINTVLFFAAHLRASLEFPPIFFTSLTSFTIMSKLAIWASRLSVAVTIVRILSTGTSLLLSKIVAVIFGLMTVTLLALKLVFCDVNYACPFLPTMSSSFIHSIIASFVADLWLLGAPSYLLWKMNLEKRFHRILQAIFATEILVLATSIAQSVYVIKDNFQAQAVIAEFKITISLIVCNLLSVATHPHRLFQHGQESPEESTTAAPFPGEPNSGSHTMTMHTSSKGESAQTQDLLTTVFISSNSHSEPSVGKSRSNSYTFEMYLAVMNHPVDPNATRKEAGRSSSLTLKFPTEAQLRNFLTYGGVRVYCATLPKSLLSDVDVDFNPGPGELIEYPSH
ncbi:hypothetical protein BDQ17DRAFT_1428924 [Cyathus striatus]|nr:hypothetical protein BDQ17DRAFT_1428924 [Cyathus striatus]